MAFIAVSFALVLFGLDRVVSKYLLGFGLVGSAIAGAFYTFGITTPFSMVVILELMQSGNAISFALVAALVATCVDCLLFSVVKNALEKNTEKIMEKLHCNFAKLSAAFPVLGFFAFGMPVPDEIALALMSLGKINLHKLFIVVFLSKFMILLLLWKAIIV